MSTANTAHTHAVSTASSTRGQINGILFVALFAAAVTRIAAIPSIANLGISPLIVGIVGGMIYGNALKDGMPESWAAGVNFSARKLLRIAVAFFGLRVSLLEIAQVGLPGLAESVSPALAGWTVRPFALTQVKLAESLFTQKRDRMLGYARGYGGTEDVFAGPDRVLSIFRANAGLDTKGAQPVGSWENGTGYLRGHYAGHFMSMLSQAYAGTGDAIFKQKLDYIVKGLAENQQIVNSAPARPTPLPPAVAHPHGG